ncbi:repressor LexA [Rhodocyclaceae bacterium]|nr:repressor LexA [Rhodocyclaceae bacterium]
MTTPPIAPTSSLGRRIKDIRLNKGLTQKEFADSIGIVQGFLSGIEREKKTPSDTLLIALCNLYEINETWLASGQGEMYRTSRRAGQAPSSPGGSGIPVLERIGEEFPRQIGEDDIRDRIALPGVDEGCYAIVAYGDFMAPTIRDGDLVIFKPGEETENGAIVLVTNRWGEAILRRYRVRNGDVVYSPDNATYSPFTPAPETRIIGTVAEVWRKVKL